MNAFSRTPDRDLGSRRRWAAAGAQAMCGLVLLLALGGCSMMRLQQDLEEIKGLGLVTGPVTTPGGSTENVIVALFRETDQGPVLENVDQLTTVIRDYIFILDASSPYLIVAFQDQDGDRIPDPGEPAGIDGRPRPIIVEPEQRLRGQEIRLTEKTRLESLEIDFEHLDLSTDDSIPIAAGDLTSLDDPRFTGEQAKAGMWTPLTAAREVGGGVYFLEPHDPDRIPVLFVHGIGGSPQDFRFLIERLDRTRYQPWIYHYPTGMRLYRAARLLERMVTALHQKLGFERLFVTAHSMGGLVARSFILQAAEISGSPPIALFVTFSTPWNGHRGAAVGVKYAPAVVPCWIDMQPGSDFLKGIRADLPAGIPHYLFFGFQTRSKLTMPYSHDTVVAVASQLAWWVQEKAHRIYGFDLDHVDILSDEEVARNYTRILDQAAEEGTARH